MTSHHSIKTDVINARSAWQDTEVVGDLGVVTSRNPGDLKVFSKKIIEVMAQRTPSLALGRLFVLQCTTAGSRGSPLLAVKTALRF